MPISKGTRKKKESVFSEMEAPEMPKIPKIVEIRKVDKGYVIRKSGGEMGYDSKEFAYEKLDEKVLEDCIDYLK